MELLSTNIPPQEHIELALLLPIESHCMQMVCDMIRLSAFLRSYQNANIANGKVPNAHIGILFQKSPPAPCSTAIPNVGLISHPLASIAVDTTQAAIPISNP